MLVGIVDIGSNTIRMNVYRCEGEDAVLLFTKKETAGLIAYVKKGVLSEKGIQKACSVIRSFRWDMECLGIQEFHYFSTASLRNLKNREEVLKKIQEKCEVTIEVLSGNKEARLSFLGALGHLEEKDGIFIDVGGGSSEIVIFEKGKIVESGSMPVGSLSLFEQYAGKLLPQKEEKKKMVKRVEKELDQLFLSRKKYSFMCGVGGSIRGIEKLLEDLDLQKKDSKDMNVDKLSRLEAELCENEKKCYQKILQVKPDRIHTLVPGILIIKTIAQYFGVKKIQISKYGVREGYLNEKVLKIGDCYETLR